MCKLKKIDKILYLYWIFVLLILSCASQDDEGVNDKSLHLEMPGEGGAEVVQLDMDGWDALSVWGKSEVHKIRGDIYEANGELVGEGWPLELEGQGHLKYTDSKVGFTIQYESPGFLEIQVKENASGQPYTFIIVLQQGEFTQKLYVNQAPSAGYDFEAIQFYLEEEDQDSIYMRQDVHRYQFDFPEPRQVEVSPFNGADVMVNAYFESNDPEAFVWLENDSTEVEIPSEIREGEIYFSGHQNLYGVPTTVPYESELMVTIDAPEGHSAFSSTIEMRKRKVSYQLTLKRKSDDAIKIVKGKWIEISPTGSFEITQVD